MPEKYPKRKRYENLLVQMAVEIQALQQNDGFWKFNLLEPLLFPISETRGTAFFCYDIAWGLDHKILSKEEYMTVVQKSWSALNSFDVHPNGKLGFVQIGWRPSISIKRRHE